MENHELGHYYTLGHLTQFTGLTDRTLRSYLSSGILEGEKINGVWHFTPEQLDAFLRHPAARPSILAKNNSIVYDFMLDTKKPENRACIILDLPDTDCAALTDRLCDAITNGDFRDFRFSYDGIQSPRLILSGPAEQLLPLLQLVNLHKSTP